MLGPVASGIARVCGRVRCSTMTIIARLCNRHWRSSSRTRSPHGTPAGSFNASKRPDSRSVPCACSISPRSRRRASTPSTGQRPFFGSLTQFMASGPVVVLALEADDAIKKWRALMGATDPAKAEAGHAAQGVRRLDREQRDATAPTRRRRRRSSWGTSSAAWSWPAERRCQPRGSRRWASCCSSAA